MHQLAIFTLIVVILLYSNEDLVPLAKLSNILWRVIMWIRVLMSFVGYPARDYIRVCIYHGDGTLCDDFIV